MRSTDVQGTPQSRNHDPVTTEQLARPVNFYRLRNDHTQTRQYATLHKKSHLCFVTNLKAPEGAYMQHRQKAVVERLIVLALKNSHLLRANGDSIRGVEHAITQVNQV